MLREDAEPVGLLRRFGYSPLIPKRYGRYLSTLPVVNVRLCNRENPEKFLRGGPHAGVYLNGLDGLHPNYPRRCNLSYEV